MSNFDRIAGLYALAEYFLYRDELQEARTYHSRLFNNLEKVLFLGEGDGRGLARFLTYHKKVNTIYVDSSGQMCNLAKERCKGADNVRFYVEDLLSFLKKQDNESFDLLVFPFVLDVFPQEIIKEIITESWRVMTKEAFLWVIDYQFKNFFHEIHIALLYKVFGCITNLDNQAIPNWAEIEDSLLFHSYRRKEFLNGLIFSQVLQKIE